MSEVSHLRVTLVVPTPPAPIFAVLADPRRHREFDASGTVRREESAAPITAEGQVFRMHRVALGGPSPMPYVTDNRVEVFARDQRIGWRVEEADGSSLGWSWRFDLTPLDEGRTEVALTYDWSATPPDTAARYGIPDQDAAVLEASLTRLARLAMHAH